MTMQLQPDQQETINHEVMPLAKTSLVVRNAEDEARVVAAVRAAEELMERIEDRFHPSANRETAYRAYEQALDTEKAFYEGLKKLKKEGAANVKTWRANEALRIQREAREAQERQAQKEREEQAKRDAEARAAQEEADRKAVEEFQRIEAEKKKSLELQQQAEASGNAKVAGIAAKEVARLEGQEQAVQEEHAKKSDEIQTKAQMPLNVPAFKPTPAVMKTVKVVWKARVVNQKLACDSIAAGLIPWSAVEFKLNALNELGKAYTDGKKIPGIEFFPDTNSRV